jgi:hypothetical protein
MDCSWNSLKSDSARALEVALAGNAGLRELLLSHNGFSEWSGRGQGLKGDVGALSGPGAG